MSKIALIASAGSVVDLWRQATGIGVELAPWIMTRQQIEEHGPFSSALCLAGWNNFHRNVVIYDLIVAQITAARLAETPTPLTEGAVAARLTEGEWFIPENLRAEIVEPIRPAATFPSIPPLSENERVLREFGVNPALIGMLEDEMQNSLVAAIRRPPSSVTRDAIEEVARRRNIAPWAETISTSAVRQDALRIVQEFYGTNAHFQTMNDSRLFACCDLARRGLSAMTIRSAADVVQNCRDTIHRILVESISEELTRAAGFLDPDTGPPAERTPGDGYEPPAYREAPTRRAYSDPLRDHLRTYMQQERETPRRRINPRRID